MDEIALLRQRVAALERDWRHDHHCGPVYYPIYVPVVQPVWPWWPWWWPTCF